MARWIEGTIVENHKWTDELYSLRIKANDGEFVGFKPGQFGRLALEIDGKPRGRPYSFVNAPHEEVLEFYSIIVPDGPLSTRLAQLGTGDAVMVGPKGAGFFTLDLVSDADTLWMLSTGTALGPFLSILKTEEPWLRFKNMVLVHGVRTTAELAYREVIEELVQRNPGRVQYVPFVTREETDFAMHGRVPAAIKDGSLQERVKLPMTPEDSQIMICGNPDMVRDTKTTLGELGFKANTRKEKGHITTENYW